MSAMPPVTLPNGRVITGVPEGTTKEQIKQKAIASGMATEADFAQIEAPENAEVPRNLNFEPTVVPEKQGMFQGVKDFVAGGREGERNVFAAPELNEFWNKQLKEEGISSIGLGEGDVKPWEILSGRAFKSGLGGLLTGDPKEIQQIIAANYPEAEFGTIDGQEGVRLPSGDYLLQPEGVDPLDVARFGTDVVAFIPAGGVVGAGVRQLGKGAAVAGGTQAALQGVEASVGGEFNPEDVAIETATQGAFQVGAPVVKAAAGKVNEFVSPMVSSVLNRFKMTPKADPYKEAADALAKGTNKSIMPQVMADPEVLKAANDLGINVNPGVYSTSEIYRQMERALKQLPMSKLQPNEVRTLNELGQKADDLLMEWTGTTDKSAIADDFTERMLDTVSSLKEEADALYATFRDVIPDETILQFRDLNTLDYITERANAVGGFDNLPTDLKRIHQQLSSENGVTQGLIDELRMDVGETLGRKSDMFKSLGNARLKSLYAALSEDSLKQPEYLGLVDEVRAARALIKKRKDLEESLVGALGKDLSKSLMVELNTGVKGLMSGSTKNFNRVMDSIPMEDRELVSIAALNTIFSGGGPKSKQFGAENFVSSYEALMRNKRASDKLFQYIPEDVKNRVDSIYKVTRGLVDSNRKPMSNPSGTAAANAAISSVNSPNGPFSKLFKVGSQMAAGAGVSAPFDAGATGAAAGFLNAMRAAKGKATEAADELISNPEFQEAMQKYVNGDQSAANSILTRIKSAGAWIAEQPPEVKRSIARQGLIQYLMSEDE